MLSPRGTARGTGHSGAVEFTGEEEAGAEVYGAVKTWPSRSESERHDRGSERWSVKPRFIPQSSVGFFLGQKPNFPRLSPSPIGLLRRLFMFLSAHGQFWAVLSYKASLQGLVRLESGLNLTGP